MLILGIESATPVASAALVDEEGLLGEVLLNVGLTHSEQLLPLIDDLLRQCRRGLKDVTDIAVSAGPGSFTGLRIGMATAKALVQGLNGSAEQPGGAGSASIASIVGSAEPPGRKVRLLAVSTLEAMAWSMPGWPGLLSPMHNARRNQVYAGLYRWREPESGESADGIRDTDKMNGTDGIKGGDRIKDAACPDDLAERELQEVFAARQRGKKERMPAGTGDFHWILDCLVPPVASSPGDWAAKLKETGQPVCLLGDGAGMYREIWQRALGRRALCLPPVSGLTRGSFVALAAQQKPAAGEAQEFYRVKPLYLRGI